MRLRHLYTSLAVASIASVAGAAEFTGFGIDAELQFKATGGDSIQRSAGYGTSVFSSSSFGGEHAVAGAVGINYGLQVAPRWIVQLGIKADVTDNEAFSSSSTASTSYSTAHSWTKIDEKRHYSLYVQPGYLIHAGTMIYGKLSYHHMHVDGSNGVNAVVGGDRTSVGYPIGSNFKGFGVGFGLQALFSKNMYGYAEINHVRYGQQSIGVPADPGYIGSWDLKPRTTSGSLGIGWRF